MPAGTKICKALIAAALTLGLGSGNVRAAPVLPELGNSGYAYEAPSGGTFHPSHHARTPSLEDLAQIGGAPAVEMFTLDTASPESRFEAIPEPAGLLVLVVGVAGLGLVLTRRRRR